MEQLLDVLDLVRAQHAAAVDHEPLGFDETSARTLGRGARIGLLDTAYDRGCPDLLGAAVIARDFLQQPWDAPKTTDDNPTGPSSNEPSPSSHGTCSLLLLVGQGRERVRGAAPAATVLFARVIESDAGASPETIAAAIDWLVAEDASVIALPLGAEDASPAVARALERGVASGSVFFAACGSGVGRILFPARHPNVVSVAPSGPNGRVMESVRVLPGVDCVAPGGPLPGLGRGASIACVIAAGVAALGP